MPLGFLVNVPIKTRFQVSGTGTEVDPMQALFGQFTGAASGVLLELDAAITEDHEVNAETTDYPIETGAIISDHYFLRPRKYSVTGMVSDSPVQYLSALSTGLGSVTNVMGISTGELSRSLTAYQAMLSLMVSATPFEVVTGLDFLKNMVVSSLRVPRSAVLGRQFRFSAELKQLNILKKGKGSNTTEDLFADTDELGYLSGQIPNAVVIAGAALFLGLVGYQLLK
jgi:hypothetical protein